MRQGYKSLGDLVAELKMTLAPGGAVLAVEGDDDMRFWEPRKHADCYLVDGEGKPNVVHGLRQLDASGHRGALGLIDRDYDTPTGTELPSANLVATDGHDLECLLCRSAALDRVLAEHGDRAKIKRFEREAGHDVRTALLQRALPFGRLRWLAHRESLSLDIRVAQFADKGGWTVDEQGLFESAAGQITGPRSLSEQIDDLPEADPWYTVHGKDLLEILRLGLQSTLGDIRPHVGVAQLARSLRLAIPDPDLQATGVWRDMRAWEARNPPHAVLPQLETHEEDPN